MKELALKNGVKLEYVQWVRDDKEEGGSYVHTDVTDNAAAYIPEPVRFAGETNVRDIFAS